MARMENDERVAMVRERFRAWREGRRRGQRIPADLSQAAVGLVDSYSVEQVAAALSVNEQRLAKRVGAADGGKLIVRVPISASQLTRQIVQALWVRGA